MRFIHDVTLKQLAVFASIAERRGFGAAADQLKMGQSAVSHTMASLEKAVGASLVTRSSPVSLTELGRVLLPHAHAALAASRSIESVVESHHQVKPSGNVRIAASPTAAHRLLPRLLALWKERLPGIDVRIFEGGDDELTEWLNTGAVDCAILIDPEVVPDGGLELIRDVFRAVVRADHPYSSQESIELAELLEDPLLVSSNGCEPQIEQLHRATSLRYEPAQRVRELSTLLSMVESDLGVAIMPSLAASILPEGLAMVDLVPRLERRLVFSGPHNRAWHPYVSRMRDVIAESSITL